MRRLFLLLMVCLLVVGGTAQTTKKIKELESRRNELQQQIAESESLLQSTNKDVRASWIIWLY